MHDKGRDDLTITLVEPDPQRRRTRPRPGRLFTSGLSLHFEHRGAGHSLRGPVTTTRDDPEGAADHRFETAIRPLRLPQARHGGRLTEDVAVTRVSESSCATNQSNGTSLAVPGGIEQTDRAPQLDLGSRAVNSAWQQQNELDRYALLAQAREPSARLPGRDGATAHWLAEAGPDSPTPVRGKRALGTHGGPRSALFQAARSVDCPCQAISRRAMWPIRGPPGSAICMPEQAVITRESLKPNSSWWALTVIAPQVHPAAGGSEPPI
mgnify:CR=1 FL=1